MKNEHTTTTTSAKASAAERRKTAAFASTLRNARKAARWRGADIAEMVGASQAHVGAFEAAKYLPRDFDTVLRLADAAEGDPAEFVASWLASLVEADIAYMTDIHARARMTVAAQILLTERGDGV